MIQQTVVGSISGEMEAAHPSFRANPSNLMGFLVRFKAVLAWKRAYARH